MSDFCNYEGSDYKERFWTEERRYEDLAERRVLERLLPPSGGAIVELGAGFGRQAGMYGGYERVFLVDYSRSLLAQARERYGGDGRFTFVASDIRRLPLASAAFDTAVTVRVLHHIDGIAPALREAHRVLKGGGAWVLEYANKRHLKAIARYLLGRQGWNPFSREPVEFVALNFDFHPAYMQESLEEAGFRLERRRAVSLFRWGPLKRRVAAQTLVRLESLAQPLASLYPLSPSVIVRARSKAAAAPHPGYHLACPECHGPLQEEEGRVACPSCAVWWPVEEGIYDFKEAGRKRDA